MYKFNQTFLDFVCFYAIELVGKSEEAWQGMLL